MPLNISVDISSATKALGGLYPKVEVEVLDALDEIAAMVARDAKADHPKVPDEIQGERADAFRIVNWAKTGEYAGTYRFLTRTANLRGSITPRRAHRVGSVIESRVVAGMEYANDIEFGTPTRRAFPFMRPALETQRSFANRRIELAVRRGIGNA